MICHCKLLYIYNLPHHFPAKRRVIIEWDFRTTSKIVPWNAQANDLNFEKVVLWQLSQVSCNCKAFSEERSHIASPTLLTPIQAKVHTLKISHFVPHCANKYAKEKEVKEKNMTIFTQCHGELLMTVSNYLLNKALVYQVTKGWFLM